MDISCAIIFWNFFIATYLADVIRDDGYNNYKGQFTVVNKGRMLRVLMFFNNVQREMCALHCVRHLRCRSINYNYAKKDCELTDEDFNESYADTITRGWHNYGTPPKVDGGWSAWRNFTVCTKSCGSGTLEQFRECDSPKAEHGGADCKGRMRRTVKCNTHECKAKLNLDGTKWGWYHNGKNKNGEIELTLEHKVRWNGGNPHGRWRVDNEGQIEVVFNGVTHILQPNKDGYSAVLIQPVRNPPSKIVLQNG